MWVFLVGFAPLGSSVWLAKGALLASTMVVLIVLIRWFYRNELFIMKKAMYFKIGLAALSLVELAVKLTPVTVDDVIVAGCIRIIRSYFKPEKEE